MQTIKDNLATIVVGVFVTAVLVGACVLFGPWHNKTTTQLNAIVHDGDGEQRTLPLSQDARLTVVTDLGKNTLVIENGSLRMEEADCPNGSCLKQRPISHVGEQIICLPHKLWVEVVAEGGESTELNEDAVDWGNGSSANVDLVAR